MKYIDLLEKFGSDIPLASVIAFDGFIPVRIENVIVRFWFETYFLNGGERHNSVNRFAIEFGEYFSPSVVVDQIPLTIAFVVLLDLEHSILFLPVCLELVRLDDRDESEIEST